MEYPVVQGIPNLMGTKQSGDTMVSLLTRLYDTSWKKHKGTPKSCGYTTQASYLHRLNIINRWMGTGRYKEKKILDIGCGTGLMTRQFAPKNQVWGVDISIGLLKTARKNGIMVVRGAAGDLPFVDGFFDLVVCVGVLPYYENPETILAQIKRVAAPGAAIVVITPADSWLTRSVRAVKNMTLMKSRIKRLYSPSALGEYVRAQDIDVLEACLGYGDRLWCGRHRKIPAGFRIKARVAAVFGRKKVI